jgi:hypothetical protein
MYSHPDKLTIPCPRNPSEKHEILKIVPQNIYTASSHDRYRYWHGIIDVSGDKYMEIGYSFQVQSGYSLIGI